MPFVVDYNGQRFGKYPIGWPVLLAVALVLGGKFWLNPLLAGFSVWLTYRLGQKVWGETVGLLAALLPRYPNAFYTAPRLEPETNQEP